MTINPPRKVRVTLYLLALFVAPLAVYGQAEGWLDNAAAALVAAYLAVVNGLALANTGQTPAPVVVSTVRGQIETDRIDMDVLRAAIDERLNDDRDLDARRDQRP